MRIMFVYLAVMIDCILVLHHKTPRQQVTVSYPYHMAVPPSTVVHPPYVCNPKCHPL